MSDFGRLLPRPTPNHPTPAPGGWDRGQLDRGQVARDEELARWLQEPRALSRSRKFSEGKKATSGGKRFQG